MNAGPLRGQLPLLARLSSSAPGAEMPDRSLQGEGGRAGGAGREWGRHLADESDDKRLWGWAQVWAGRWAPSDLCFTAHGSPRPGWCSEAALGTPDHCPLPPASFGRPAMSLSLPGTPHWEPGPPHLRGHRGPSSLSFAPNTLNFSPQGQPQSIPTTHTPNSNAWTPPPGSLEPSSLACHPQPANSSPHSPSGTKEPTSHLVSTLVSGVPATPVTHLVRSRESF